MKSGEYLFISDLHLSPEHPETSELFLHFLAGQARRAERIYVLGDLFDAWIGDDDDSPLHSRVIAALRKLSDTGTALHLQHGNRDFLLGKAFARAAGCSLMKDPERIELHGVPTLLMHGDLLCTDDLPYQKFRRKVRNPVLQWLFLRRGLDKRRAQAAIYRHRSAEAKSAKNTDIMDVNQTTVMDTMRRYQVRQLIHGHTHRQARHELTLDGQPALRWVLAEWTGRHGSTLSITPDGSKVEAVS